AHRAGRTPRRSSRSPAAKLNPRPRDLGFRSSSWTRTSNPSATFVVSALVGVSRRSWGFRNRTRSLNGVNRRYSALKSDGKLTADHGPADLGSTTVAGMLAVALGIALITWGTAAAISAGGHPAGARMFVGAVSVTGG